VTTTTSVAPGEGGEVRLRSGGRWHWARRGAAAVLPSAAGSLPVLVVLAFTGLPVVLAVLYTLGETGGLNATIAQSAQHQVVARHGLTLGAYQAFIDSPDLRADLWVTLWVTALSTVVLVALSWLLALFVRFGGTRVGRAVSTVYVVPMFIPTVIASYALVTFWEGNGRLAGVLAWLGLPTGWLPGFTSLGVVLALVWTNIPFAVILISSSLQGVPEALIEAARDVGASWPRICWSVLLPLNKLSTIIVITFTAVGTLGSFTVPDLMGPNAPQMLGVAMTSYYQSYGQPQMAEVMSVVVFLAALLLSGLYIWAMRSDGRRGKARTEAKAT
jgi:ABC-type spermidine/putrescine transport system permease subunit I